MKSVFIIIMFLFAGSVRAQTSEDRLFRTDTEHVITIEFYNSVDWDSIKARFNIANESLVYTSVKIIIDNTVFDSAGMSIKGNTWINTDKTVLFYPFKIDMNEFKKGQKYDSIKKFNLNTKEFDNNIVMNNMYAAFQLPHLRVSKARVFFGTTEVGEYLIVEQVDKTYLRRLFGNDGGNLYKGDKQADLTWLGSDQSEYETRYTLKTNEEENDFGGLVHFIDILNNMKGESALEDSLKNNFDVESYMKILSLQVAMGKHDDYFDKNHNYYLYHNEETNKFCFIPYDNDMIRMPTHSLFMSSVAGMPLYNSLFSSPALKRRYVDCMCAVIAEIESVVPAIENKYGVDYSGYKEFVNKRKTDLHAEILSSGYDCPTVSVSGRFSKNRIKFNENCIMHVAANKLIVNPASANEEMYQLKIYSMDGQVHHHLELHGTKSHVNTIDISFLQPGIYIVGLKNKYTVQFLKIAVTPSRKN